MKEHSGGLGNFLNEVTQTADKDDNAQTAEQIVYIDIDDLETNPKNFYGLRDVDALASLIAVSHLVEPLTVSRKSDGKYRIITGHRRRAALQKLLEEGIYTERKLPCIIKTRGKIKIEQENGEVVEFDEDAVEMLNLIASNRGQREERIVDEKLQEVKYLESFAKAIYHQKDRGKRGRFRNFFAEEILNMSKSQLQRISALEKLTDKVRAAIDDKQISESAALAMSNMTAAEQDACLEKIISGEIKGTAQDIQNLSVPSKVETVETEDVSTENVDSNSEEKLIESTAEEITEDSASEKAESKVESESEAEYIPLAIVEALAGTKTAQREKEDMSPEKETAQSGEITVGTVGQLIDVPEEFDDPQREAKEWFYQECLAVYETIYRTAKRLSEEEESELKSAQWGIRASVARYKIEELKLQHEEKAYVKS